MKKFFAVLLTLTLFAATPAAAQFNWGIKAGVNLSERPTKLSDLTSVDGKAGWFVGPMAKFTIPLIGLGVEANLFYSQATSEVAETTITKQSIDLPVFLRYELSIPPLNKFIEPFVSVGPQWSWNIGDKNFDIKNMEDLTAEASQYSLRKSTLSLNLGLGVVILNHLQVYANYNWAMGNTSSYTSVKNAAGAALDAVKSRTNTWQVSLAYIF